MTGQTHPRRRRVSVDEKSIVLTRRIDEKCIGTVHIGTEFAPFLPRLQAPTNKPVVDNWTFLQVTPVFEDVSAHARIFAGLNIWKLTGRSRVLGLTFGDAVLVFLSQLCEPSELLSYIIERALSSGRFVLRTLDECANSRAEVTRALLCFSRGRDPDPAPGRIRRPPRERPVLIYTSEQHLLIECTHKKLARELSGIAALAGDGTLFSREKDGALVFDISDPVMSVMPEGRKALEMRIRRVVAASRVPEALRDALRDIKRVPRRASEKDATVEKSDDDVHLAIFVILWAGTAELTKMEESLLVDPRLCDVGFMADDEAKELKKK